MRSGTSPALAPVASFDTIWLSGITVSAILLSPCPVFQRSTMCWAALAPLARTHMLSPDAAGAGAGAAAGAGAGGGGSSFLLQAAASTIAPATNMPRSKELDRMYLLLV